ncbi:hypothetical protein [Paenibacillus aceris]|uniref:Uncharacterized protein n=1 Tax=Paenibacillus aceris TaxID=869555 RepID=A0ABS4HWS7_9BACL|nr:hypothetical protein [Paenibacillus aceris]MBP1962816.1 hypothetical protein [Paenibacillus aceris]NHW38246.1 hypothetical protein [Paenibacillus aceris]
MMNEDEIGVGMGTMHVLTDYQLERWIRSNSQNGSKSSPVEPDWRQLTQYAAYHAINDWYSLPPKSRTRLTLTNLFERRWTNKFRKFESLESYMEVKRNVLTHLYWSLTGKNAMECPLMLFESSHVWVEGLNLGLSQIMQVMEPTNDSFIIHKYMMEENEAAVQLFFHMSVVFCYKAFGQMPVRLQLWNMMNGKQYRINREEMDVNKSMDYLKLVKEVYLENDDCPCCSGRIVM